jgi:riboflavin kinase/FMN adenylyltransferase
MLGRPYSLWGKIVKGNQLGRQLGFPTANIEIAGRVVPPNGVYAAHVNTEGIERRAVANVGYRPTLGETTPRLHVEAHLFEFDGDLYGKSLELTFHHKLRDEKKFDSIEGLKSQIQRDADAARLFFD